MNRTGESRPVVRLFVFMFIVVGVSVLVVLGGGYWYVNLGVLAKTRVQIGGERFALWLRTEGDQVWASVQQNPGWNSGVYSTSVFVAADAESAADYRVPVVPRSSWSEAKILVDRANSTARFVIDHAEIEVDLKSADFGDAHEIASDAARTEDDR